MKKFLPLLALGLLTGCTTILETGDKIERGQTPDEKAKVRRAVPAGTLNSPPMAIATA